MKPIDVLQKQAALVPVLPPLPQLPPGIPIAPLSPAALVLLIALVIALILISFAEPPRPRKPHVDQDGKSFGDNKFVLKVYDGVEEIENALIREENPILAKMIFKAVVTFMKIAVRGIQEGPGESAEEIANESVEFRQEIFGELATDLQNRLRAVVLPQWNARTDLKKNFHIRRGKLRGIEPVPTGPPGGLIEPGSGVPPFPGGIGEDIT